MMKLRYAIASIALVCSALTFALGAEPEAPAIGKPVPDFALIDATTGKTVKLSDHAGKTVVICFQGVQCAMVDRHLERFHELLAACAGKGVVALAINSNADESAEAVRKFAENNKLPYPSLKDPGNNVADMFGATHTPFFAVIDAKGVWRYAGRIDDNPFAEQVKLRYLRDALDAVLAGRDPATPRTKAFGCKIARERK